jgi:hypothetical protein
MHTFFLAVVVVFGITAAIMLVAWLFLSDGFKLLEDPVRRRRCLMVAGGLYCFCSIFAIAEVLKRDQPPQALLGLPIGLFFIWLSFRAARKIKIPPKE